MNSKFKRGDIYFADLGYGVGSEQHGYRPVLIIQNDVANRYSPTVIVASFTSKAKKCIPTHYKFSAKYGLQFPSILLLEQIRTIDKKRLKRYIGHIDTKHFERINNLISLSLGITS